MVKKHNNNKYNLFSYIFFFSILKCPHCDKRFLERANMKNHIRNIHSNDENYLASLDPRTPVEIRENNVENEDKKMVENEGKKVVENEGKKVVEISSPTNKHSCNICGKMLLCRQSLKRHLKIHMGLKPHKV